MSRLKSTWAAAVVTNTTGASRLEKVVQLRLDSAMSVGRSVSDVFGMVERIAFAVAMAMPGSLLLTFTAQMRVAGAGGLRTLLGRPQAQGDGRPGLAPPGLYGQLEGGDG